MTPLTGILNYSMVWAQMAVGLRQPSVIIREWYQHVGLLSSICYQKPRQIYI